MFGIVGLWNVRIVNRNCQQKHFGCQLELKAAAVAAASPFSSAKHRRCSSRPLLQQKQRAAEPPHQFRSCGFLWLRRQWKHCDRAVTQTNSQQIRLFLLTGTEKARRMVNKFDYLCYLGTQTQARHFDRNDLIPEGLGRIAQGCYLLCQNSGSTQMIGARTKT